MHFDDISPGSYAELKQLLSAWNGLNV